jgi:hypothetical protein
MRKESGRRAAAAFKKGILEIDFGNASQCWKKSAGRIIQLRVRG